MEQKDEPEMGGNEEKKLLVAGFWISTTFMRDVGSSVLEFWECILQLSTLCVQGWMFVGMAMQDMVRRSFDQLVWVVGGRRDDGGEVAGRRSVDAGVGTGGYFYFFLAGSAGGGDMSCGGGNRGGWWLHPCLPSPIRLSPVSQFQFQFQRACSVSPWWWLARGPVYGCVCRSRGGGGAGCLAPLVLACSADDPISSQKPTMVAQAYLCPAGGILFWKMGWALDQGLQG